MANFERKTIIDIDKIIKRGIKNKPSSIKLSSETPRRQFTKGPSSSSTVGGGGNLQLLTVKKGQQATPVYDTAQDILTKNKIGQDILGTRGFKTWSETVKSATASKMNKLSSFKPQTWKGKEKLGVLLFTGFQPPDTLSDKNATVTKQSPDSETVTIQDQEEEPIKKIIPDTTTTSITDTDTAVDTAQDSETAQIPITDTKSTTTPTTTITGETTSSTTSTTTTSKGGGGLPPSFFKLNSKNLLGKNKKIAFDVYVREKGKFIKASKKPLPKNKALNFGADIVDRSSAVTFKIIKSKRKTSMIDDFSFLYQHKFRNKKPNSKIKQNPVFIEKNKFRIDTPGELRGITARGILANKRKSAFKGFGKKLNLKKGIF